MQLTLEPVLTVTVLSGFWSEDFWDGGHIAVKCTHISFCYMLSSEVCVCAVGQDLAISFGVTEKLNMVTAHIAMVKEADLSCRSVTGAVEN